MVQRGACMYVCMHVYMYVGMYMYTDGPAQYSKSIYVAIGSVYI